VAGGLESTGQCIPRLKTMIVESRTVKHTN
jgi:hypothetical protein